MESLTAREHAVQASELLIDADGDPEVLDLSRSHALAALALCMTEEDPNPDDAAPRFTT